MKPYKILFKFPTRSRPDKFFLSLDNIINNIADKVNYKILVSADANDTTMYNKEVLTRLKYYMENYNVVPVFGTSKSKIDAVNRDVEKIEDFDIIIVMSDDMEFQVYGNLHFNDGFVGSRVSTMSIMGRLFYDLHGKYIYHPSYFSLFCDDEYTLIANKLNKMHYFPEIIFKHKHPANGFGVPDKLLDETEAYYEIDKKNFLERQSKNFYL